MTEITQADRDAAAQYDVVEAFARHREAAAAEERAKIVAWLERRYAPTISENIVQGIEAGEHLK